MSINRNLHIIQATVTWDNRYPFKMETQFKHHCTTLNRDRCLDFSLLDLSTIYIRKELIVQ